MIKTANVEKTTTYKLTPKEIEDLILKEAGVARGANITVKVEYSMSGGYDGYDSRDSRWEPYVFSGVTITITEKTTT